MYALLKSSVLVMYEMQLITTPSRLGRARTRVYASRTANVFLDYLDRIQSPRLSILVTALTAKGKDRDKGLVY